MQGLNKIGLFLGMTRLNFLLLLVLIAGLLGRGATASTQINLRYATGIRVQSRGVSRA